MPLDAICLTALLCELRPELVGARVDKIQQPQKDTLLLTLRGKEQGGKLLLAAGSGRARLHLTEQSFENPQSPPMFCMLLRKHLTGAKLAAMEQPPMERIVFLRFDTYNELGEPSRKTLILELLGQSCNLILIDEDEIILDALRRVDEDMSRVRRILPGLRYRLPEGQEKQSPLAADRTALADAISKAPPDTRLDTWLQNTFQGLSPLICRELIDRGFDETDARLGDAAPARIEAFLDELMAFFAEVRAENWGPYQLAGEDGPVDFSYTPIRQYKERYTLVRAASFSALLDGFYEAKDRRERHRQQAGALLKTVTNLHGRTARKLEAQRLELEEAADRERFREQGDLITANLHTMKKGQSALVAQNFYDPEGGEITIPLDPLKTPQQNAAAYFKRYAKAKTAQKHLAEQMEKGERELDYLSSVLESIDRAESAGDVAQIQEELQAEGILRRQTGGKKQKPIPAKPLAFLSSTGMTIYAGKNNVQNDQLTFKTASRHDTWLHVQKLHGSHVIIATGGQEPDVTSLEEAAAIAAFYSQGRAGSKVPVDYTLVKYVKKPTGGKPGAAHYVNYKTIYANPDEALADRLKK